MMVQGRCYKCGGFLAVDDTQDASDCPFCGKAFVVTKAVSYAKDTIPKDSVEIKYSVNTDSDFVIERSVLVHYNGYTKKDICIPDGITVIGDGAFKGMSNIESVIIPDSVEKIGWGAFSDCKNLKTVNISDSVESIDRDVFNGCISLKTLKIPDSVKNIEAGAFTGCTSLESVNIPPEIELLPWRIFEGCTSLKYMIIPKKVKTIEDCAFAECTSLEGIRFECMHQDGDPSTGIIRIGMNAFRNCTSLISINIPETVEFIGNQAFRGCSKLKRLVIPKSVKAIYPLAFADCTDMEQVNFTGNTELYKGSNPYKYENSSATFFNCTKLLNITYNDLQKNFWAFPAYFKSHESENIAQGKCRHCGGDLRGVFEKVCTICGNKKDY